MSATPIAAEHQITDDTLREGIAAAACVRFFGIPLSELTRDELLSAAGYLYIEVNALQQRLDAIEAALAREGFSVVDSPAEAEEPADES
jgi:hypothetical protein